MILKKGIQVKIITGKDKGKTGEILEIDRKLNKVKHFQRFTGETLKISLNIPFNSRKQLKGVLESSDSENIFIEIDGEIHALPYSNINTARLVPIDFKPKRKLGVTRK